MMKIIYIYLILGLVSYSCSENNNCQSMVTIVGINCPDEVGNAYYGKISVELMINLNNQIDEKWAINTDSLLCFFKDDSYQFLSVTKSSKDYDDSVQALSKKKTSLFLDIPVDEDAETYCKKLRSYNFFYFRNRKLSEVCSYL